MGNNLSTDNWKHRSAKMKCSTCMWFAVKDAATDAPSQIQRIGRCRRHAPIMSGYPATFETDWCGDHKLDENRL